MNSLFAHFGEQGAQHRGLLHWSEALDGVPFRGSGAPTLTQAELQEKLAIVGDFHVAEFDLAVPEQRAAYEEIMTRINNGWYALAHCDRSRPMTRVVEWVQRYAELSPTADAARSVAHAAEGSARPGPFGGR